MANFGYDDDVLLIWEITGTGRRVGSYIIDLTIEDGIRLLLRKGTFEAYANPIDSIATKVW